MLAAKLVKLRRRDKTMILKSTFMKNAALWIKSLDEFRRTPPNHTVAVRKRFRHDRIGSNNGVVSEHNPRKNDSSHPDPTIFPNSHFRFYVLAVVMEIMVGTDDPNIRGNLSIVAYYNFPDTLNVAPWHQSRRRFNSR